MVTDVSSAFCANAARNRNCHASSLIFQDVHPGDKLHLSFFRNPVSIEPGLKILARFVAFFPKK
jgi:hypothetical protein